MSLLNDTEVQGRITQTLPAENDNHLIRKGEARTLLNSHFKGDWDEDVDYEEGDSVNDGGSFYIANTANIGLQPSDGNTPTTWRLAAEAGASSFTYIRYATDDSGTGFSTSPSGKTYVAFKTTTEEIASPIVGDFAGLWVKFVGDVTTTTTSSVSEGSNLYFTVARVRATALAGLATGSGGAITDTDTILQAFGKTEFRLAALEAKTTSSITEGSNLYYTDARARAAHSATAPATYNSSTGAIGVNSASANTADYLVRRDSNGDFAARKVTLNTSTGTDHLTFGTSATMGYDGTNAVFNKPLSTTGFVFGDFAWRKTGTHAGDLYDSGEDVTVATLETAVLTFTAGSLALAGATGVLMMDGEVIVGSATTDDLDEGVTNLYFTTGRAADVADDQIAAVAGQANGLAQLGGDGKLASAQIPSTLLGATVYQGTWNANTNSPALASGTGTKGNYYVVSVAGTTTLDTISSWAIGDWVIFNGTVWQKVDNTDAVLSVNSLTGTVTLTTTNIAEGSNLYFTEARVLGTDLASFDDSVGGAIVAADTVLAAFGKTEFRLAAIEAWDTDDLTEGSTNLYYTDARVKAIASTGLNKVTVAPSASSSGSPNLFVVTGPAHTTLAAGTEAIDVYVNLNRIVEFATGALATQRAVYITAPKYAFGGASTITNAATLEISGPPNAHTNATITTAYGLKISTAALNSDVTAAYALHVTAPTSAVSNYAALFSGNVSFGATPSMGGGVGVIFIANAGTPPGSTPTGGGVLYCDSGALKFKGSGGTVTTVAPA